MAELVLGGPSVIDLMVETSILVEPPALSVADADHVALCSPEESMLVGKELVPDEESVAVGLKPEDEGVYVAVRLESDSRNDPVLVSGSGVLVSEDDKVLVTVPVEIVVSLPRNTVDDAESVTAPLLFAGMGNGGELCGGTVVPLVSVLKSTVEDTESVMTLLLFPGTGNGGELWKGTLVPSVPLALCAPTRTACRRVKATALPPTKRLHGDNRFEKSGVKSAETIIHVMKYRFSK